MHGHFELLERAEEDLHRVGERDGRRGIRQQERAGDEHRDAQDHEHGAHEALIGDGDLPEGHELTPGREEDIEHGRERDDDPQRLEPAEDDFQRNARERDAHARDDEHDGVGHVALGREQRRDIDDGQQELAARVEPVHDAATGEKLAEGDVLQHTPASFPTASSASVSCSSV